MVFERGSELERAPKVRIVWIARWGKTMGGLERPRTQRVVREVGERRPGREQQRSSSWRRWCRRGQKGWQRKREKRYNSMNEGSSDYALQVASALPTSQPDSNKRNRAIRQTPKALHKTTKRGHPPSQLKISFRYLDNPGTSSG